jgi:hypothetical protein
MITTGFYGYFPVIENGFCGILPVYVEKFIYPMKNYFLNRIAAGTKLLKSYPMKNYFSILPVYG